MESRFIVVTPNVGLVSKVAFAWGLLTFLPVGINYLGLFLLLGAVIWQRDGGERLRRLRMDMLALGLLMFALWTLLILALQETWYEKTPSNLWHGFRILLTLSLAASLSNQEAKSAMTGFMLGSGCVLLLVLGYQTGLYSVHPAWEHLTVPGTNKTIAASILLTMAFALLLARAFYWQDKRRWILVGIALIILLVIVQTLSKRTAILGALIAASAVLAHVWRSHKWRWILSLILMGLIGCFIWLKSPSLQAQFLQGIKEINDGMSGTVKVESWNVRIQMIKHTFDMMLERPLVGWGIGAWNHQWELRVPDLISGFNMPHNDFLWMGAQGGFVAGFLWLFVMLSGLVSAWKAHNWHGATATATILIATFSALVNNGTRDATIGLPMLWIMGVSISMARKKAGSSSVATVQKL